MVVVRKGGKVGRSFVVVDGRAGLPACGDRMAGTIFYTLTSGIAYCGYAQVFSGIEYEATSRLWIACMFCGI